MEDEFALEHVFDLGETGKMSLSLIMREKNLPMALSQFDALKAKIGSDH